MTLSQYIKALTEQGEQSESVSEVQKLSDRLFKLSRSIRKFNSSIENHGTDECSDLDMFLEDAEARAMDASKKLERLADEMISDDEGVSHYGTWGEQIQSDFYATR